PLLPQLHFVKMLSLRFDNLTNHLISSLHLPWTMPHLQVLSLRLTFLCHICGIAVSLSQLSTICTCLQQLLISLKRDCTSVRTFYYNEKNISEGMVKLVQ